MMIPFLDIKSAVSELRAEYDLAYKRVMDKAHFVLGNEVQAFEMEFAQYCSADHCVGVANGLDALTLILRAMDIGPGDEVIVPGHTFIATWLAVSQVGAIPVPVDVRADTFNLDPELLEAAITKETSAIIVVHLYGQPAEIDSIKSIAERHELRVIEDAAQSHGAEYRGQRCGTLGEAAAFSFYPGKNLGALGDGGAVVTNNNELAEKVRILSNYGSRQKYIHDVIGCNSRLDELQAAFLRSRLKRMDEWNERRRAVAQKYFRELDDAAIELPYIAVNTAPVWHLFVVKTSAREGLSSWLREAGIGTLVHYPIPPHRQGAYLDNYGGSNLSVTDSIAEVTLSLPMGPHLTERDQDQVIAKIIEWVP